MRGRPFWNVRNWPIVVETLVKKKTKFWSNIEILVKKRNFGQKSNFGHKSKFWSKIEFWSKIKILVKNRILLKIQNFGQKSNFAQNSNFGKKSRGGSVDIFGEKGRLCQQKSSSKFCLQYCPTLILNFRLQICPTDLPNHGNNERRYCQVSVWKKRPTL